MMMKSDELSQIIQKRKSIYTFLRSVYEKELTKGFLAEMPGKMKPLMAITDSLQDAEAKKVVKDLVDFSDTISSQNLSEIEIKLAADYARLFLSINKTPPHPSESIYREGAMMQYSRDEVLKVYWSFGIDKKKEFTEPEDHIAIELSFIEYLCDKAIEALNGEDIKEVARYIQGQTDFLETHLIKWVPKLVEDILSSGRTPFYKAIAVITNEYIGMDLTATKDLLNKLRG